MISLDTVTTKTRMSSSTCSQTTSEPGGQTRWRNEGCASCRTLSKIRLDVGSRQVVDDQHLQYEPYYRSGVTGGHRNYATDYSDYAEYDSDRPRPAFACPEPIPIRSEKMPIITRKTPRASATTARAATPTNPKAAPTTANNPPKSENNPIRNSRTARIVNRWA